jgi:hypothetical protein
LADALTVAAAIQDGASGMAVSKLTLANLMNRSPSSSEFRELLLASRAYGLTAGGVNADFFELTSLGNAATGADEMAQADAMRKAVLNVEPFRAFCTAYNGKKVPSPAAFQEFLTSTAGVPPARTTDCAEHLLDDARFAGLLNQTKGGEYVDLTGGHTAAGLRTSIEESPPDGSEEEGDEGNGEDGEVHEASAAPADGSRRNSGKKVFIAHGKNRTPLDQLKKMLDLTLWQLTSPTGVDPSVQRSQA